MGFERYKRVKQPHDKLFIESIFIYSGWIDRIGMIGLYLFILYISVQGRLN